MAHPCRPYADMLPCVADDVTDSAQQARRGQFDVIWSLLAYGADDGPVCLRTREPLPSCRESARGHRWVASSRWQGGVGGRKNPPVASFWWGDEATQPWPLDAVARCSHGVLTCTLRMTSSDAKAGQRLWAIRPRFGR